MPKTKLLQVRRRYGQREGDDGYYSVTLLVDGRKRVFSTPTFSAKRAIELAYFFWTGNKVDFDLPKTAPFESEFTEEKADPQDFEDLNQVPFWSKP